MTPGTVGTAEIGRSGLFAPRLGVGTVPLGNMLGEVGITVDDAAAVGIVSAARSRTCRATR
jgi:hypothetical protein